MNIMLVDDEVLTRTNIKYMIETEIAALPDAGAFVLCGEAADGAEALEKLPLCKPDIILSDMRMPGMDGLELCKVLRSKHPDLPFIALSNYDDYEYVRGTLQHGAIDYILKHQLSAKGLLCAFRKAQAQSQQAEAPLAQLSGNSTAVLRREFLLHLLTGFYTESAEVENRLRTLELPLATTRVLPVAMCINDYKSTTLRNSDLITYSIVNIVSEILSDQKNGAICHIELGDYALLLAFSDTFSENVLTNTLRATLSRIRTCMTNFLNLSVSFSVGSLCNSFGQIPQAFQAASEQLRNRFYEQPGSIVQTTEAKSTIDILNYFNAEKETSLTLLVQNSDFNGARQIIDDLFGQIRSTRPALPVAQMIFTDLLGVLNRICKQQSLDMQDIYTDEILPEKHLSEFSSLSSVHSWFSSLFERLCTALQARSAQPTSLYVKQATAYIHSHFQNDISLSSTAQKINVSHVYLSRLFKQELEIGFSEYLMQVRIKRAQALLRQGKLTLRQVAHTCGFGDYTYFLKAFKKQTGSTPTEYQRLDL